jgi:deazaflavin-dependent oxidoreductase (nitroreductase family)
MKTLKRLFELYYFFNEYLIMSIISRRGPGFFFRFVFRLPIYYYRIGLGPLVGGLVLLLTAKGRKSGLPRVTPLGFTFLPSEDTYYVVAGWGGKTDWYQNARANPEVTVRVGRRSFATRAEPVSEDQAIEFLKENARRNPFSKWMWPRWTGETFDSSDAGLRRAAAHFPMIALKGPGLSPD